MPVETKLFGKSQDGQDIFLYSIKNTKGMQVDLTNFGAIIVNLFVPDKTGNISDVVLGYDKIEDYFKNSCFFGAVIGPSANRIGDAQFEMDGKTYQLAVNDGKNNLHSDFKVGYHKQLWDAVVEENSVTFSLKDTDGNMGFPGNKEVKVTYSLDEDNGLTLHYHGCSDKKTIINLTNHTYFNLDGQESGSILEHELTLNASNYTPVVPGAIPTGEIAKVSGTVMDFTSAKKVGKDINEDFKQLRLTGGYDHNWVIDGWNGELQHFATVKAPKSGRIMKAYTNLPGVQFYAGNSITKQSGKKGAVYEKRQGLCLETQYYPDTIHQPDFPACVFGEGKDYDSVTVYRFE